MNVKISVIVTAHDKRKEYLPFALQSLQYQTFKDFELIVVKNFQEYDDLIEKLGGKSIVTKSEKLGGKIVEGIRIAEGDIICLLEDDDLFEPNKIEFVYNIFSRNNISIFHNEMKFIDEKGNRLHENEKKRDKIVRKLITDREISYNYLFYNFIDKIKISFNLSSMAFKKNPILKYLHYLPNLNNGLDTLIFFMLAYNNNIYISSEKLTFYRVHSKNYSKILKEGKTDEKYVSESYLTYLVMKELGRENPFFKILSLDAFLYLRILDPNFSTNYLDIIKSVLELLYHDPRGSLRFYTFLRNTLSLSPKIAINKIAKLVLRKYL
ncbi:glycosyltransferase family 2 protein [Metallosphaera sedula]|uniref:glycosyltransferase family 2 protein n=1 Tax=Metallosphaera sedula TaxID=43687 RepID=UPI0020C049F8|nr:glycosyltransferase [Metallosphaera sedula]BBL47982.1 glycosyl transferase [Metallosphaera sedula]